MPSRAWPAAYTAAVCFVVALALLFAEAARPDDDVADTLTAQFAALGGEGWTGADGSWSVGLPGGSVAWFFGDTFLGGITADGRRAASSSIVRNSALVQSPDGSFRTVTGGTPTAPRDLVPGNGMNDWFWPGPPVAGRGVVQVPMAHIIRTGPGSWDVATGGTDLVTFSSPGLDVLSHVTLATPVGVHMASAAVTAGGFTYIYGVHDLGGPSKEAFVARVRARRLGDPWAYWSGGDWTTDTARARPIIDGVSDQFSVLRTARDWRLVTQVPCKSEVVAYTAQSPTGPWRARRTIATIPSTPNAVTYNAVVHSAFSQGGRLVLGYNVSGMSFSDVFSDASLYRPRFIEITLR